MHQHREREREKTPTRLSIIKKTKQKKHPTAYSRSLPSTDRREGKMRIQQGRALPRSSDGWRKRGQHANRTAAISNMMTQWKSRTVYKPNDQKLHLPKATWLMIQLFGYKILITNILLLIFQSCVFKELFFYYFKLTCIIPTSSIFMINETHLTLGKIIWRSTQGEHELFMNKNA